MLSCATLLCNQNIQLTNEIQTLTRWCSVSNSSTSTKLALWNFHDVENCRNGINNAPLLGLALAQRQHCCKLCLKKPSCPWATGGQGKRSCSDQGLFWQHSTCLPTLCCESSQWLWGNSTTEVRVSCQVPTDIGNHFQTRGKHLARTGLIFK